MIVFYTSGMICPFTMFLLLSLLLCVCFKVHLHHLWSCSVCIAVLVFITSHFHLFHQDDIPELQEFFLVNITSAVLITTLATAPQLGTQQFSGLELVCTRVTAEFHSASLDVMNCSVNTKLISAFHNCLYLPGYF